MGTIVKWAQMKDSPFSGPKVAGTVPYVLPANPTSLDIIVAAIAKPEGGDYDTVVMYDGTAVTYGLLQWTFTSGRLHKLVDATEKALDQAARTKFFYDMFGLTGLSLDSKGDLYRNSKKITDFFSLRDVCTPPGGACPKTGKNWEKAKAIALLFSKLGENPIAQRVQLTFFQQELMQAIGAKRPQMGGHTIGSFLYPNGWEDGTEGYLQQRASRALFWGMWQNSPAKAQTYLGQMVGVNLSTQSGLEKLAKKFAFTPFARWGVVKAKNNKDKDGKPKPYTSRYQKVAEAINDAMGQKIVPEYWK